MIQVYPDIGLVKILLRFASPNFRWHLYTNNYTPVSGSVLANFTEAAWGGYAPVVVNGTDFTITGITGHIGTIAALPVGFGNTTGSPQPAYGYFVTDDNASPTDLFACARFDAAPIDVPDGGGLAVIPIFSDIPV